MKGAPISYTEAELKWIKACSDMPRIEMHALFVQIYNRSDVTPARKAALQWIHDRGEVRSISGAPFSGEMLWRMERDGQVHFRSGWAAVCWSLTDEGRRALNGDKT